MTEGSTRRRAWQVREVVGEVTDDLTVEEPMEIRIDGTAVAVVMRTPGHDADLALGFALTEGIISDPSWLAGIDELGDGRWELRTTDDVAVDASRFQRNFYATSSCGVCGKASIDAIRVAGVRPPPGPVITPDVVRSLPERLAHEQELFSLTGGLHAAALFDETGRFLVVREDIGRHNAVDKVIGDVAGRTWPFPELGLVVSGRISFEITQKAAVAGIGLVCGVSASSSLAVDLADEFGMTVVGFVRDPGFTVYAGPQRIEGLA